MSKKDLKLPSSDVPSMVGFYRNANMEFLGKYAYVPADKYSIFRVLEDDLRELGIPFMHYADTVVKMLAKWTREHGLRTLPINVFCGDWALSKYKKVLNSSTISISDEKSDRASELLHSELMVARSYIQNNVAKDEPVRMIVIVKGILPLLDKRWLMLYNAKKDGRPINDVIEIICDEYGINSSKILSYRDIVTELRELRCKRSNIIAHSA